MGLIGCALSPCPWLLPVALTRNGLGAVTPGPMYLRSSEPRPTRARRQETGCRSDSYALGWPPTVWSADFKGWFRLKAGHKCYPLTITDGYSRYLLRCAALEHPDMLASREVFDAAFVEFGLPTTLRTDNGTPFDPMRRSE